MRRVAFDLISARETRPSGLGYYAGSLYEALQAHPDPQLELIGLEPVGSPDLSTPRRARHDRWEINRLALAANANLIHQPAFSAPKSRLKVAWTLHDLRAITANERMPLAASLYWRRYLPYSARYADQIVCTSPYTIEDAVKVLGRRQDDFQVIPIGLPKAVTEFTYQDTAIKQVRERLKITGPYFASVGTIQPVKNFPYLVELFASYRQEHRDHQLVIIGKKGGDYEALAAAIKAAGLIEGREVIITDYVTDEDKYHLIHDAEALLFPSRYEGFGIPPLEAQQLGTPVISANNSSLPWVIGEGGILVPTDDTSAWLQAIDSLPQQKAALVKAGQENVKRFNWQVIARQWQELYKNI